MSTSGSSVFWCFDRLTVVGNDLDTVILPNPDAATEYDIFQYSGIAATTSARDSRVGGAKIDANGTFEFALHYFCGEKRMRWEEERRWWVL